MTCPVWNSGITAIDAASMPLSPGTVSTTGPWTSLHSSSAGPIAANCTLHRKRRVSLPSRKGCRSTSPMTTRCSCTAWSSTMRCTPGVARNEARLLIVGRGLRAFVDGYVAVLLPAYLLALGFGTWEVGLISTATLLGSALATIAVGTWGHRLHHRRLLLAAGLLMAATGLSFAGLSSFWPLLA